MPSEHSYVTSCVRVCVYACVCMYASAYECDCECVPVPDICMCKCTQDAQPPRHCSQHFMTPQQTTINKQATEISPQSSSHALLLQALGGPDGWDEGKGRFV
eukprot:309378-Rhodomonas_salina.2